MRIFSKDLRMNCKIRGRSVVVTLHALRPDQKWPYHIQYCNARRDVECYVRYETNLEL